MLKRIVRMDFRPDAVEDFLKMFRETSPQIRNFPGCSHLELLRDAGESHVFYTLSVWAHPSDLEAYRNSELFRSTWELTRSWFQNKPAAFSLLPEMEINGK